VSLDVALNHRAQSVICTMRDISLGGAFLATEPDMLPYAGTVELNVSAPGDSARGQLRLQATIERTTEQGAAVSFGDVARDDYFHLVDLVTSN
jgi:hypothetical protein